METQLNICRRYTRGETQFEKALQKAWQTYEKIQEAEQELDQRGELAERQQTDPPPFKRYRFR